jgi:hypothetical protein
MDEEFMHYHCQKHGANTEINMKYVWKNMYKWLEITVIKSAFNILLHQTISSTKKHFPAEKSQVNSSKYEKVDGWKLLALSSSRF